MVEHDERGSASVEATLVAPILIVILVLAGVVTARGAQARIQLDDVAHQAARAASIQRTHHAAEAAAQAAAADAVDAACAGLRVSLDVGRFRPGGTVTVTVSCEVDLTGPLGRKRLYSRAVEPIDTWRATHGEDG
ncbi:TadE/TadG family type IV pilus assembly protein [Actinokineospora pegani]|uniref:TadE/TadG family type IV pilus assembly protein n=1 Tax=Actinokineospora pegani TaxID=2654637 RepID=UPI0012E9E059|nr:TadE family protein [Actinokineospora pegani]